MKKGLIILGNVLIILAILVFVMIHVGSEQQRMTASKMEAFREFNT